MLRVTLDKPTLTPKSTMPRIPIFIATLLLSTSAFAAPVSLSTPDGVSIRGDATGSGDHGVLLVHQANGSSQEYNYLSQKIKTAP